jgi:hypothetical protein
MNISLSFFPPALYYETIKITQIVDTNFPFTKARLASLRWMYRLCFCTDL